jgi:hypothetical protein
MKDYLITVLGEGTFDTQPLKTIRLIEKTRDYAKGVVFGLKVAYSEKQVFIEEIKKLKE